MDFTKATPQQIAQAYYNGFQGCIYEPKHMQHFLGSIPHPYFADAAYQSGIVGSGEGKLSLPFKCVLEFDKQSWDERQTTGDAFIAGTMVTMADHTLKPIEDVKIGDYVISDMNNVRRVINTFKKTHVGKMIKLRTKGNVNPVVCTNDHRFAYQNGNGKLARKDAEFFNIGDKILIPYANTQNNESITIDITKYIDYEYIDENTAESKRLELPESGKIRVKNGRSQCNRYIPFDERLGWLIGLYAAEGSMDYNEDGKPWRITYNLGSHESLIAKQAELYIKELFGHDAIVTQVPSKKTVIYVRINNAAIACLFSKLCPGNVYSKALSNDIFNLKDTVRLSIIKGWTDGDGHLSSSGLCSGVTVSHNLALSIQRLSVSLGLCFTIKKKKPIINKHAKTRQDYYDISYDRESSNTLYKTQVKPKTVIKYAETCQYGILSDIIEYEQYDDVVDVYCFEVEHDNSFIANGYGVNNCVSHGTRNAVDITRACEILVKGLPYGWIVRGATEPIYGSRGHGGQGMSCSRAAEYVSRIGGIALRKNYEGIVDLTKYNSSIGSSWGGRGGPPEALNNILKQNQVKTVSLIRSIEEARDALANGYGVNCCSGHGFSGTRDENGVASRSGGWSHSMAWTACDARPATVQKYGGPLFLVQNSWGRWNGGGHPDWGQVPDGSFLIKPQDAAAMIRGGGTFVYSNVDGFPPQKIPDYGMTEFL